MKEIVAKEGMWLTQVTLNEGEERIFVSKVTTPYANLWAEWSNAEKEQWKAEHPAEQPEAEPVNRND